MGFYEGASDIKENKETESGGWGLPAYAAY